MIVHNCCYTVFTFVFGVSLQSHGQSNLCVEKILKVKKIAFHISCGQPLSDALEGCGCVWVGCGGETVGGALQGGGGSREKSTNCHIKV